MAFISQLTRYVQSVREEESEDEEVVGMDPVCYGDDGEGTGNGVFTTTFPGNKINRQYHDRQLLPFLSRR